MTRLSLRTLAPLLVTVVLICLPLVGLAQGTIYPGGGTISPGGGTISPGSSQSVCTGSSCEIQNPLAVSNFCDLIKIILQAILVIGMPVAVVFLVIVGFKFIAAQGNPEKIHKAQESLLHTVIGIAVFLGAWAIAKIIAATLAALGASAVNSCIR